MPRLYLSTFPVRSLLSFFQSGSSWVRRGSVDAPRMDIEVEIHSSPPGSERRNEPNKRLDAHESPLVWMVKCANQSRWKAKDIWLRRVQLSTHQKIVWRWSKRESEDANTDVYIITTMKIYSPINSFWTNHPDSHSNYTNHFFFSEYIQVENGPNSSEWMMCSIILSGFSFVLKT